jgi:hypothetical protein
MFFILIIKVHCRTVESISDSVMRLVIKVNTRRNTAIDCYVL